MPSELSGLSTSSAEPVSGSDSGAAVVVVVVVVVLCVVGLGVVVVVLGFLVVVVVVEVDIVVVRCVVDTSGSFSSSLGVVGGRAHSGYPGE